MEAMADAGEKADVVFMDPPRNGSTQQFMDAVDRLHPGKLVYISCGPEALKRDLEYLESMDYRVKTIIPVDMFPYTEHTEVVCCLERQTIEDRRRQL